MTEDDETSLRSVPTEQTVKPACRLARLLIARLERGERSNDLDVLIEVATFQPDALTSSCRANSAGTKVVYTGADGAQQTCWARDWSTIPDHAIARLKATGSPR